MHTPTQSVPPSLRKVIELEAINAELFLEINRLHSLCRHVRFKLDNRGEMAETMKLLEEKLSNYTINDLQSCLSVESSSSRGDEAKPPML